MKLLQVIRTMDPRAGGCCQAIRNLAPHTFENGCKMDVVCLDDPEAGYLSEEGYTAHGLGRADGSWAYRPALRGWLDEHLAQFDAVILNGLWQYPNYALLKSASRPGMPPYFVFPHGMLDPWFQRSSARRIKAIRNLLYWKLVEQRVIHQAEAVLFTCSEEKRLAAEAFRPYHPKRQINVGFGVSEPPAVEQRFKQAFAEKCPGLNGRPYFLFLGRIDPKKGVDLLIQAYAETRSSKAAANQASPCLVVAGPGLETPFGNEMRDLATKSCPPGSVFFPGMLTGDAKWGALYFSEAFALISHQENFGIAVAESLACGRPVLISNKVNIWREIDEDNAGLAADDNPAGARQLFQSWFMLSTEEKAAKERAARSTYEKRFCSRVAAQNLLTTIEELAMRSRVRSPH